MEVYETLKPSTENLKKKKKKKKRNNAFSKKCKIIRMKKTT